MSSNEPKENDSGESLADSRSSDFDDGEVSFTPDDDRNVRERLRLTLHELQSPILSLRIRLESLRERTTDDSIQPELSHCLDQLGELDRMSRQLLTMDEFDSIEPLRLVVDWPRLFALLELQHRPVAELRDVQLSIEGIEHDKAAGTTPESPTSIHDGHHSSTTQALAAFVSDPNRIRLVLSNLLDNAIVHAPPKTSVRLSVGADLEGVSLCVRDSGPGLPTEFLSYLFEPFRRPHPNGDPMDSRLERQSFGLGLSLARKASASLGGHLEFESDEGLGTKVTLWLPRAQ